MKNTNLKTKWNTPIICFCLFFTVIFILFLQFCYLSLSKNVYGINMQEFASSRNTVTSVLTANRGTIYDVDGNVLAQNITSYTLIAYLDSSRTVDESSPQHVVDKDYTATKLASILGEENYDYILSRLNSKSKQVEFGNIGKNLTELTKLSIDDLNLPGISFVETVKRYYPNGNFASYIIGYAKQYSRINIEIDEQYDLYQNYKNYFNNYTGVTIEIENKSVIDVEKTIITGLKKGTSTLYIKTNGIPLATILVNVTDYNVFQTIDTTIVGELGIESNFEKELQGTDGYIKYQQDKYGYKIPDTPEEKKEPIDGYNIYLTIDSNIQRFAETSIKEIEDNSQPKWSIVAVMDAKEGSILASATSPSFNPNSLTDEMSYQNPLVSYSYEPGSVMKIYTYMCAIETGQYDGNKTYLSGHYDFDDGTTMHDWDKAGWGYLTYDNGFNYSSNVAIINIIKDYLNAKELRSCLEKYGFSKETGIELNNEVTGELGFKYETEIMAAGFGQGISTTPIQQLQALSIIANDGVMVKPHIISKMINNETNEQIVTEIKKSDKLVSDKTIEKIKDLMESVISPTSMTGKRYYLEGYGLIGKTGTAQIYENGSYLTGQNDYIISIALLYPKENPQIIIYSAVKQPSKNVSTVLYEPIKELVKNISKYKNIFEEKKEESVISSIKINTYINNNVEDVKQLLEKEGLEPIIIGNGEKVIKQYPSKNTEVIKGDKVFLLTSGNKVVMPNMINWSRFDVSKFCNLINIECTFDGYGYVVSQSIESGKDITNDTKIEIKLGNLKS